MGLSADQLNEHDLQDRPSLMGYTNRDKRYVTVTRREKNVVKRLRRRAERRELNGEHPRRLASQATRRGWWYA